MQLEKIKNFNLIKDYLYASTENFCNFSLGTKYMWGDESEYEYKILNDTLILKESTVEYKNAFYYPIGKDIEGALKYIEEVSLKQHKSLLFCLISDETVPKILNRYENANVYSNRNWADYIYLSENLRTFKGKKYSGERNHYNKFIKTYPQYKYHIITKNDIDKITEFLNRLKNEIVFSSELEKDEYNKNYNILKNMFKYNCVGGFITIDNEISAFCIGEVIGNTFYDHVEKASKKYDGIYQALVKETAMAFTNETVKYINREDDSGDMGLRRSKMQYQPIEIKNKNFIVINTVFDKIAPPIIIKTSRLLISDFNYKDAKEYYNLCTDDNLNKYWGYNYKDDIKEKPELNYFINFAKNLISSKEEYPLAIRLDNKLIGEVTMHNFNFKGEVEIGVRILKQHSNNGYGLEAMQKIKDYCYDILEASKVKAKCYKENLSSYKMLNKLKFKNQSSDDTFFYFYD